MKLKKKRQECTENKSTHPMKIIANKFPLIDPD